MQHRVRDGQIRIFFHCIQRICVDFTQCLMRLAGKQGFRFFHASSAKIVLSLKPSESLFWPKHLRPSQLTLVSTQALHWLELCKLHSKMYGL